MKFVTVMDMWLLLMNLGLLGFIIYFGRNVLKTLVRIASINEKSSDSPERTRILNIIESEIELLRQMQSMGDKDAVHGLDILEHVKTRIMERK